MRSITVRNASFVVRDSNHRYWDRADSGRWETETFDVLDTYVDSHTTVVDIGAWIGPISLYCATIAERVISVEPDPIAFAGLAENVRLNPGLENITIINAAVATKAGRVRLGVRDQAGDSTSSMMLQGGDGWDVEAMTLAALLAQVPPGTKLFMKVDIEGYEFDLIDEIVRACVSRNAPVYLSLHPHHFEISAASVIKGRNPIAKLGRSVLKRSLGRSRALKATRSLMHKLAASVDVYDESGRRLSMEDWPRRVLRGRNVTETGAVLLKPRS